MVGYGSLANASYNQPSDSMNKGKPNKSIAIVVTSKGHFKF